MLVATGDSDPDPEDDEDQSVNEEMVCVEQSDDTDADRTDEANWEDS